MCSWKYFLIIYQIKNMFQGFEKQYERKYEGTTEKDWLSSYFHSHIYEMSNYITKLFTGHWEDPSDQDISISSFIQCTTMKYYLPLTGKDVVRAYSKGKTNTLSWRNRKDFPGWGKRKKFKWEEISKRKEFSGMSVCVWILAAEVYCLTRMAREETAEINADHTMPGMRAKLRKMNLILTV